jgi:hypothetical protein
MVETVASSRGEAVESLCADRTFKLRVLKNSNISYNTVLAYVGGRDALTFEDQWQDVEAATALGYYRALGYRFLREVKGYEKPEVWLSPRRPISSDTWRDRSKDFEIIRREYPEFDSYVPRYPLTEEEVLAASREELYDMTCSTGTDLHQAKLYGNYKTFSVTRTSNSGPTEKKEFGDAASLRRGTVSVRTGTRVIGQTVVHHADLSDAENSGETATFNSAFQSEDMFGPVLLRAAGHFIKKFGVVPTTYWLWEKVAYPGEYIDLLRVFGGDELDKKTLNTKVQSLTRKLREMDEELPNLVNDLQLRAAHEAMSN